eukprot:TRINITY_DN9244_c0_g1_i3.p1 TRINITY_DN9244_c0_g1~~TRINITY_DN9244_c0_g1_i3.p1  ORF type:complete len:335 (-),score=75.97 TRINITY_DN9244_c0_g1_i3:324-1328(-)
MRALVVSQLVKDPSELSIGVAEEPQKDDDGCVLVEIHAIGLNFFEFLMVQGKYQTKPDLPFIPGSEFSGVVVSTSPNVKKVRAGDRVYGSSMMGAFAERISVPETNVRRMPEGMSFSEGAAFGMVYATSYAGLVLRAQVRPGETVLVHAAAGGVGTAAVQIAKSLGATVIATVGSKEKVGVAKEAGADHVIDLSSTDDFASAVKDLTGGRGADVIYDPVGGGVFDRSLSCVAWNGRILVVGFASGTIPQLRANRVLLKSCSVMGVYWGAYQVYEPHRVEETLTALEDMYARRSVRPLLYPRKYSFAELPVALSDLASRKTTGKVVVTVKAESKL